LGQARFHYIDVLAGQTINHLDQLVGFAKSGQIVVGPEVLIALAGQLEIVPELPHPTKNGEIFAIVRGMRTDLPITPWQLPPLLVDEEKLRPWLLPPIYQRLKIGLGEFITELRPAVALFLHFGGLDYDGDPGAGSKLNTFICQTQEILARYDGILLEITMGEKGDFLYGVFGAPIAHENDAERAMRAALELVQLSSGPQLSNVSVLQVGISQGIMRTGAYGSQYRHTYGVLGDEVNLAARLMQAAAPGQILVSASARKLTGKLFQWESVPELWVKGKSQPIQAFSLRGISLSSTLDWHEPAVIVPIIGRTQELNLLQTQLHLVKSGSKAVVVLEGEPGIGKSRLIADFVEQARRSGFTSLIGTGNAIEQSKPYHAWQPILNQLLQLESFEDEAARHQHVLQLLKELDPEMLPYASLLNQFGVLNLPETSLTEAMDGQSRANSTRRLLLALLQHLGQPGPLLIILEDAHWLDSASWALALAVSQMPEQGLLLIATRPAELIEGEEFNRIVQNPRTTRIKLAPLSVEDSLNLACHSLGVSKLAPEVARLITEKSEGTPFYVEELAYVLRDTGLVRIENGNCRRTDDLIDFSNLNLPNTVERLITSRIDCLPPAQELTIKTASVIGRVFKYDVLYEIYPANENKKNLLNQLENLDRLNIATLETPPPDRAYTFKHIITQEVAYGLMTSGQRRHLHQAVARWYEERYRQNLSQHYALLAYHWNKAEIKKNAIEYLEKAGGQALKVGAYREALKHFKQILALTKLDVTVSNRTSHPELELTDLSKLRQAHWQAGIGQAYIGLGRGVEAAPYFEQSLKLTSYQLPASKGRTVVALIEQLAIQLWHRSGGYRPGVMSKHEAEEVELVFKILQNLNQITLQTNQLLAMLYIIVFRANLADKIGQPGKLAKAYSSMALAMAALSLFKVAEKYLAKARQLAAQSEELDVQANVAFINCLYHNGRCRFDLTFKEAMRSAELYRQLGNRQMEEVSLSCASGALSWQGKFSEADSLNQQIYQQALATGNLQIQLWTGFSFVQALFEANRLDEAKATLGQMQPLLEQPMTTMDKLIVYSIILLLHLRQGEYEAARHKADELLQVTGAKPGRDTGYLIGYRVMAEVYLTSWEKQPEIRPLVEEKALKLIKTLKELGRFFPLSKVYYRLYLGYYNWLTGKPALSRTQWQKALSLAQKHNFVYEEGRIHYFYGWSGVAGQLSQVEHLNKAARIFSELDLKWYLEQVQELVVETTLQTQKESV
jgi:class 3 adenylate cyclase/tetratricopeptide (TPR) repeat protein